MSKEIPFESEYTLHKLTEKNLKELFKLCFIGSEIQCNKSRVDNLAFDKETNAFVIIEYKNVIVDSDVIDQAQKYYNLIKKHPEKFIECLLEKYPKCKENMGKENIKEKDINFENTRVMIVGPSFSNKIDKPENFEFWKISLFDENEEEKKTHNNKDEEECEKLCGECKKNDEKNNDQYDGKVLYENQTTCKCKSLHIKLNELKFSERKTLHGIKKENCKLYCAFKNRIKSKYKNDVALRFLVGAVSFRKNDQIVCKILLEGKTKIHYLSDDSEEFEKQAESLKKEEHKTRPISSIKGYVGDYELELNSKNDIDYAVELFELVYQEK